MTTNGKILLIDDSPLDAELMTEVFAELRMELDFLWLRDGASGLDYLYRRGSGTGD